MVKNSGFQFKGERSTGEIVRCQRTVHGGSLVREVCIGDGDNYPGQGRSWKMSDALTPTQGGSGPSLYKEGHIGTETRAYFPELVVRQLKLPESVKANERSCRVRAASA